MTFMLVVAEVQSLTVHWLSANVLENNPAAQKAHCKQILPLRLFDFLIYFITRTEP